MGRHIHIEEQEIEARLFSGDSLVPNPDGLTPELRSHMEACAECTALVEAYLRAGQEMALLRNIVNPESAPCPEQVQWLKLAGDLLSEEEAMPLLQHASRCSACSRQLVLAQECLMADPEEMPEVESSTSEWQHRLARQMAVPPVSSSEIPVLKTPVLKSRTHGWARSPWALASAIAAVALLAVAALFSMKHRQASGIQQLLAEAYSQNRVVELRLPLASYSSLRQQRAANQESLLTSDEGLQKSKDAIAKLCKSVPDGADCLIARAELDVLAWRYQPALSELVRVREGAESRDFLLARAMAEFEKGEIEGESRIYASSYGQSIEDLSKVLAANPRDPVARFNRALVHEKLRMVENAIADWQEFLKVETDAGWVGEAQRHLAALREKKTPGS
ncbi:MAG TPA: hypothetical protein VKZ53_30035 [Candidatus Angelobacter sp.]|nr:hypothetical protein [Candidatus Angelobacter sp.]